MRTAGTTHAAGVRRRFFDRLTFRRDAVVTAIWDRLLADSQETCAWPAHRSRRATSEGTADQP